ncbi:GNAT family N-acetyltransferase [Streptomyces sp. V4-01]|uniref:GNAT family N-acetyltransferase n=1 Tax=Actinacidiphila polyblastidii TaxID=3110430 RepID=A0ABU7P664_9ACTN|nr:GNAT family N-acetyltransferase [Streptomyces sp. V4-01]
MRIDTRENARIAVVGVQEALDRNWHDPACDVDIVRARLADLGRRAELEAAGFLVKPSWVNWLAPLTDSAAAFQARLPSKERKSHRYAARTAESGGITLRVLPTVGEQDLRDFLLLYDRQIAGMAHGVNHARRQERHLLRHLDTLLGVFAFADGALIGGCLGWLRPEQSLIQLRFSAVADAARQGMLSRLMYLAAFDAARERGCTLASLGNDPSLLGHTAQPGLFGFKARLGFTPVPTQTLPPQVTGDEAELVVRMRALAQPSLSIAYHGAETAPILEGLPASLPLRAVLLSAAPDPQEPAWLPRSPIPVTRRVVGEAQESLR